MVGTRDPIDGGPFLGGGAKLSRAAPARGVPAAGAGRKTTSHVKAPLFVLDSHVHCGGTEAWVQDMVRTYRPRHAMACVLTWMKDMDLMKDAIAGHPDVFIGYGRVDLDNANAVREVETFKQNGFVGMKFHSPQRDYDDPSYFGSSKEFVGRTE